MAYNYEYPYTDAQRGNADWAIKEIKKLRIEFTEFASLNEIKYADPFLWSIINNYEKNTLVQDNQGATYLSKKPVPAGIPLTDTDYWIKVADWGVTADILRESIAIANEHSSPTATANRSINDLVWLDDYLYIITYLFLFWHP